MPPPTAPIDRARDVIAAFRAACSGPETARDWWFTVADEITFNRPRLRLPASWAYGPSVLGSTNDPGSYATSVYRRATDEALGHFARALHRYIAVLHKGGAFNDPPQGGTP